MFFLKIFEKTVKKRMLFFITMDILLICLAIWLAFLLRFDGKIPSEYFNNLKAVIILALIFCLPVFYFLKLYSFSWSYVSTNELVSLAKAITLSFGLLGVSIFVLKSFQGFPRSTFFISYLLVFIFCGGIRLSKRIYLQFLKRGEEETEKERTLIIGAGDAGEQILRNIQISKNSLYFPVGFIDDDSIKQGIIIHGLRVLGKINNIPEIIKKYRIEEMIIALPSVGSLKIKKAVELGRKAGLKKIKVVPSINEIINGQVSIRDLREIQVEDLLGRESVFLNTAAIKGFIQNKIVLITGAAGSIGSELSRQTAKFRPSLLLLLDQDETGIFNISKELKDKFPYLKIKSLITNIRDKEKINRVFAEFQPNIVFHAAAYKHVPLMEKHPDEAVKNNIFGTKIVTEAALKNRAEKFIFISTDKAVNPTSIMGATKRLGEMICQVLNQRNFTPLNSAKGNLTGCTKFISVRFGNVLNSRGSVIPVFKEQIKKGGPVEVTHPEMKRYLMVTSEAVLLVMQAAAMGQGGEVFVLDMGKPINILDLAKELIRLSGFEPDKDIPIVFTEPRPGEKFFEEILTAEEGTIATQNQKIFIAKLSDVNEEKLNFILKKLKRIIENPDKEKIKEALKNLISFYKPS